MAELADVLAELGEPEEARSALRRLARHEGEDVLSHHLRAADRRLDDPAPPEAVATWESCV